MKISTILKSLMFCICILGGGLSSQAVKFKVNLPSDLSIINVECYNYDTKETYEPGPLMPGFANIFNLPRLSDITISANAPYTLVKVTNSSGDEEPIEDGVWRHIVLDEDENEVYSLQLEEQSAPLPPSDHTFTLFVDDASQVSASFEYTYRSISLVDGENTISYNPDEESKLAIENKDYNKELYRVTLDGATVEGRYGTFYVPISDGCIVNVIANYPDEPVDVNFTYSENGMGAITNVKVNGEAVEFDGTKVTMKIGDQISFSNDPEYKVSKILCNGTNIYYSSDYGYSKTITEPTTFEVTAAPYEKFPVTINVTDPSQVVLSLGYYGDKIIELNSTSNVVEISENDKYIGWKAAEGCKIVSVSVNGEPRESNGVTPARDMVIDIVSKVIEMDMTAVVWIDNRPEEVPYFDLDNNYTHTNMMKNAQAGYTVITFNEDYNPFSLVFNTSGNFRPVGKVYQNDTEVESSNPGSYRYSFTFADKDIIKIFLVNAPEPCHVTFDIAETVNTLVMHDVIATVENPALGLDCFKGTEISITPEILGDDKVEVKVNGVPVADQDGRYIFNVVDAETLVSVAPAESGISSINANGDSPAIFNLQGISVGRSYENLAPGMYIINGRKIVIK